MFERPHHRRIAQVLTLARDVRAAIDTLRQRPGRLDACLQALQITLPKAVVWAHIRRLGKGL